MGVKSWDEATTQYATAVSLLVIAAGMSLPMAAWMLWRGMGWKNSSEMAGAMVVPVIPFLCLVWIGATESALCGPYCLVAIGAMLGTDALPAPRLLDGDGAQVVAVVRH